MARRAFHLLVPLVAWAALASGAAPAAAEPADGGAPPTDAELRATVACDRVAEPGRVRCTVDARAREGWSLGWADLVVLDVPELASPLKARVPGELRPPGATFAFALVARRAGRGEVRVRVRGVSCAREADGGASSDRCVPVSVEVRGELVVGS